MQVQLRLVRPSDLEPVYRLLSDMNVIRYMLFELHSREDTERYVAANGPLVLGPDRYAIDRAIVREGSDELIGLCGLVVDHARDEAEAWYMVLPEWWGQGVATGAMKALLEVGFGDYGVHRIWACVVPANVASSRVLLKAGLRLEGHSRCNLRVHGEWQDSYLYAVVREEWTDAPRPGDCTLPGA
jgi:[ribosomal protein S5]-alanine N-acetyltransferase